MESKSKNATGTFLEYIQFRIAVKIALAGAFGFFFGPRFSMIMDRPDNLVSGLWTVMTAIIVVQAYLGGTYYTAWIRFLGTLIGSFFACIAIILWGSNPVTLGLTIFLTIISCSALYLKESIKIASISVAVLMILWGMNPSVTPWNFATFRLLDSCLGILIAVIISHLLWPLKGTQKVRMNIIVILENLKSLYKISISFNEISKSEKEISQTIIYDTGSLLNESRKCLDDSKIEIRTHSSFDDWNFLLERIEKIRAIIIGLSKIPKVRLQHVFDKNLSESISNFIFLTEKIFDELISTLQKKHSEKKSDFFREALQDMEEHLKNFTDNDLSNKLNLKDAEAYFIFFYGLKNLSEEMLLIDSKIHSIYSDTSVIDSAV